MTPFSCTPVRFFFIIVKASKSPSSQEVSFAGVEYLTWGSAYSGNHVPTSDALPVDQASVTAPETGGPVPEEAALAPTPLLSEPMNGLVTHYGVSYHGQRMGCDGTPYDTDNESIIAVGPSHYYEWPCGTEFVICGPGECLTGVRQDACPGCGPGHLDLSEAGIVRVCGPAGGYCRVSIHTIVGYEPAPPAVAEN
jgi:hypothetical protein